MTTLKEYRAACMRARARNETPLSKCLTPIRLEIMNIIDIYRRGMGYAPTYGEIAQHRKTAQSTVVEHVNVLVRRGLLRRNQHRARSLELTPLGCKRLRQARG